jgi:hypothetical protein
VTRWQRAPGVVWRRSDSKVALLCKARDELLVLSGTGAVTWELLAEPIGEQDLIELLADEFGADPEDVASALRPFLTGLAEAGAAHQR